VESRLALTKKAYELYYTDAYAAPLFKNVTKCTKIRSLVEGAQPMPEPLPLPELVVTVVEPTSQST
jgi:hypothetical protein